MIRINDTTAVATGRDDNATAWRCGWEPLHRDADITVYRLPVWCSSCGCKDCDGDCHTAVLDHFRYPDGE